MRLESLARALAEGGRRACPDRAPALADTVVCLPARNEVERLPRLLRSLAAQEGLSGGTRLRAVVVANNCRDGTAAAVRALQAEGALDTLVLRLIEAEWAPFEAHVGTARRAALDAGADWLAAEGASDGVLLTTDADAILPPDWVTANLAALREAEIVGGRLIAEREAAYEPGLAELNARIERYWSCVRALQDRLDPRPFDPPPRHGDHTGGSLGLRVRLYRAVGGLPRLACDEDTALVARVQAAGGRLRHCPGVSVRVSDRTVGRAQGGMASELGRRAAIARIGAVYSVATPSHWEATFARQADLRGVWREGRAAALAHLRAYGLDAAGIETLALQDCPNDIAFVERAGRLLAARLGAAAQVGLDAALAAFDDELGCGEA